MFTNLGKESKLHQNNKINQNFKLYNKNIIVESEK